MAAKSGLGSTSGYRGGTSLMAHEVNAEVPEPAPCPCGTLGAVAPAAGWSVVPNPASGAVKARG